MEIITTPDPRLRQISRPIADFSDPAIADIVNQMVKNSLAWEADHPHELSAAMAAPQLGQNLRLIIIRDDFDHKENNHFTALINPEIIRADGKIIRDFEGCLSVPFLYALVPRHYKVRARARLIDGSTVKLTARGFLARTLLHEIDHLNGILFIDRVRFKKDAFYRMTDSGDLAPISDYETAVKNNSELFPEPLS